jgi:hypothetical protein
LRQEGGPSAADIDLSGAERWQQTHDAAEMDAASLDAIATLDPQFDGLAVFDESRPPFAGTRGNYEFAAHGGR